MNDLSPTRTPLERFSGGEITRRELEAELGMSISFGDVLMMLHEQRLPLPRYDRPFNPEGIANLRAALRETRGD